MKKCFLIVGLLYVGLVSSLTAQSCNCLDRLVEAKNEAQQFYKNKGLSKGELAVAKIFDRFKIFANQPHSKKDCLELISDYLDILEDDNMKQYLYSRNIDSHSKKK